MRASFIIILLISNIICLAQDAPDNDLRFKYEGMDAKVSRIKSDNMYFASLGVSSFRYDTYSTYFPLLFSISGEFGKRIVYLGNAGSISLNATPHIGVSHLFVAKVSGTANLNLFNYANFDNKHLLGLLVGTGYEFLFSSFMNGGVYPVGRGGFLYDNFRLVYQQALKEDSNSKYTLIFSSKLDW